MAKREPTLEDLRREIDAIDDSLHDLLIRRSDVTASIIKTKTGGADVPAGTPPAIRPAREAAILRRLLARHKGAFSPQTILTVWREILSASLQAQTKFSVHVYAEDDFPALARAYFGSTTPMRGHMRASQVFHACAEEPDSLGVVPLSAGEDVSPWWQSLAPAGERGPRVIGRLPFWLPQPSEPQPAYVIGAVEQEPSGDDTTLLLIEAGDGFSRGKLQTLLRNAKLDASPIAQMQVAGQTTFMLLEVGRFLASDDPALAKFATDAGETVQRAVPVGGYANAYIADQKGETS